MKIIDLRSDTVTKPTSAMRAAIASAEVGDDVYGEDPTVIRLEELAAEMLGTGAALFVTSGTQSNLVALLTHCQRGDEYIVGQLAHTYKYEGGGAAVFGSIQPQPLDFEDDGTLDLKKVQKAIKADDFHFARTKLLCLENTFWGRVLPMPYIKEASSFARSNNLKIHLDGARIFNASVKLGVPVIDISRHFDSISVCLSKGLGAPVGSVLCLAKNQIKEARRWRKKLGGGMRQAGILAAAGIFALQNNVKRLAQDHENAELLAKGLSDISEVTVDHRYVQTNMVYLSVGATAAKRLPEFLKQHGVLIHGGEYIRLVTHLDVNESDIKTAVLAFKKFFSTMT
jgi:threonine aldolase